MSTILSEIVLDIYSDNFIDALSNLRAGQTIDGKLSSALAELCWEVVDLRDQVDRLRDEKAKQAVRVENIDAEDSDFYDYLHDICGGHLWEDFGDALYHALRCLDKGSRPDFVDRLAKLEREHLLLKQAHVLALRKLDELENLRSRLDALEQKRVEEP